MLSPNSTIKIKEQYPHIFRLVDAYTGEVAYAYNKKLDEEFVSPVYSENLAIFRFWAYVWLNNPPKREVEHTFAMAM